jgi:hypothetical protein
MPLPSTASAEVVAQVVYDSVYRRFGFPVNVVADRNPKFTSEFWRTNNAKVGTSLKMSTSSHRQTDGRSEVTNKSVGQILRSLCADTPSSWADKITTLEFAPKSAAACATSLSFFEVVYGFLPTAWLVDTWASPGKSRWSTTVLDSDGVWQYARAATNYAARFRKSCPGGCLHRTRSAIRSLLEEEVEVHPNSCRLCKTSRRSPPAQNSMTRLYCACVKWQPLYRTISDAVFSITL